MCDKNTGALLVSPQAVSITMIANNKFKKDVHVKNMHQANLGVREVWGLEGDGWVKNGKLRRGSRPPFHSFSFLSPLTLIIKFK